MRAVLAGDEKAGENLNVVIAEGIIYSVGFFGLVYSSYTLALDRYVCCCGDVNFPLTRL